MGERAAGSAGPLAGRAGELALLWATFETVAAGRAAVVLVAGEPGIGKSRLLEELAARTASLRPPGATVLRGGASEAEGMPPYLPFLEALGGYIRSAPRDRLRTQAASLATTLVTILPELAARLGTLPATYQLPAEQARLRLYEAVGAFLAAIAASAPVVLLLDDLQWADPASLDLLVHVASHHAQSRLLILGAFRDDDVARTAALTRAMAELRRRRLLTTVALDPLSVVEVMALARGHLQAPLDRDAGQRLHAHSEGNPFFAEELLRGWLERGALRSAGDQWVLSADSDEPLPPGIIGVIRQRLARLPPDTIDHLRRAAVVGRTFDVRLLATISGQQEDVVEDSLLPAAAARLIRGDPSGLYAFAHDKTRECLYAEVSATRRQRLHGVIGEALEAREGQDDAQHLAALAFHFARSADRVRGGLYARRAAEQALRRYAPAEAVGHFQVGLDLLGADDSERGALLLGLGEARLLAGDERAAVAAYDAAQSWFEQAGDPVGAARAAHALLLVRGQLRALPAARAEVEAAMRLVEHDQAPRDAALGRIYAWRTIEFALQGEWRDVGRLIAVARPITERLAGPQQLSFLRQLRGLVAYQRGAFAEAVRELGTALTLCRVSDPELRAWRPALLGLWGLLGLAHQAAGQTAEAHGCLSEQDRVVAAPPFAGWPAAAALTCGALGWVALGEHARARALYPALLSLQGELHWFLVDRVLGLTDLALGDWDGAGAHLSMAATTARREGLRPELAHSLVGLADIELTRGRKNSAARADDLLHDALALFHDLGMASGEQQARTRLQAVQQLGPRLPGGVTPREASVLRLVAAGKSNRAIARDLALSEKTVANHLTSIFTKLDVDNRAAAASFAVRHDLV